MRSNLPRIASVIATLALCASAFASHGERDGTDIAGAPRPEQTPAVTQSRGELIELRGKRLYVEDSGPKTAPALLYLHGGPGSGSYDFSLYQGQRLSRRLRLVVMDQRGVLRSDPIGENEPFGLQDIIEDCEALRRHLGVRRWSVLSHSFGALVAVRYALAYPSSVESLVFESPTFDIASSSRSLLRGAAREYRAMGKTAEAAECLKVASSAEPPREIVNDFTRLMNGLGARRNNLYVHGPDKNFFEQMVAASPLPKDLWGRSGTHAGKLFAEGLVYESLLPRLREISCPALLIKGRHDLVTSDDQVAAFRESVRRGRVVVFQQSGHFPRVEEPARYASVVTRFVLSIASSGKARSRRR